MTFAKLAALCLLVLAAPVAAAPNIQSWQTPNGARVLFVEAHELPIVDVTVVFDAAGSRDGDKPGLAQFTNGLLAEGAEGLSADRIAEEFARLGAQFGNESLRDMATVELRSLSDADKLQPAAKLVAGILQRPDFPPDAVERVRNQMLVSLRQAEQSPGKLAERAFFKGLYGSHPYGSPPDGTTKSVSALTRDDAAAFHSRYYVGRNAVVAIVGDLDPAGAQRLALTLVGGLPEGAAPPPIPAPRGLEQAAAEHISYPSTQTHLLIGERGMTRLDPDYFPLYVGNHILGGSGLVSLLAEEVREKRGLSYSVYSYFLPMRVAGPFIVGLQTRNDQAGEALKVARRTLKRFVAEGPTEKELTAAKQNITGGFPLRIASNKKIVGYLAAMGYYGLPLDYLDQFTAKVEAVTREDVRDAFRRRVDPERMLTVMVGPASASQARAAQAGAAH